MLEIAQDSNTAELSVDRIRETAQAVVSRPEFSVDKSVYVLPDFLDWFGRILRAIFEPFKRFAAYLHGVSPLLFWMMVVGLILILIALIAHIVYSFRVALARRGEAISGLTRTKRFVDPAKLEADAKVAAANGDFIGAVRMIFRACLTRLEVAEERTLRAGLTNRELLGRYRSTPMAAALQTFVETIDTKWYGHAFCTVGDYEACVQAQGIVKQHVAQMARKNSEQKAKKLAGGRAVAIRS